MGKVVDISRSRRQARAPENTAHVLFFGHATALITSEKGKKILIDPWLQDNPLCPEDIKDPGELDAIVLTHGHTDHAGCALRIAEETGAQVFAIFELANLLVAEGLSESQIEPMGKGGTVALSDAHGIKIHLTDAFHSNSYTKKDGSVHYAGEACGVVVQLESGRAIYHAGDTALFSDMELIQEKFDPEVALLPIGDRFTMGPLDAARATNLIKPKTVIPVHYDTFDLLTGTAEVFSEHLSGSSSSVIPLSPGESYSF